MVAAEMDTETVARPVARPYAARVLAPDEWDRLAGLPISQGDGAPRPEASSVIVVEDAEGRIVATWAALTFVHLEGCWIDPAHQKSPGVVRELLIGMDLMLQRESLPSVLTVTQTEAVGQLAAKLGGVALGTAWQIPVPFRGMI